MLPLFLLLVFGIVDFGRALNYSNDATHLANEGARWAVVDSNPGAPSQTLQQYILTQANGAKMKDKATVCVGFPTGGTPRAGDPVEVTVAVSFDWMPFLRDSVFGGSPSTNFIGKSTMRIERPPSRYAAGCFHT